MCLTGDGDRAPLRVSLPQVHAHAATDAAVGAVIAHFERKHSGLGQHVDVSAQQSLTLATLFHSMDAPWKQPPPQRSSGVVQLGKLTMRTRYRRRDGWVVLGPGFLPSTGPFLTRLARWVHEAGLCDERFTSEDWGSYGIRCLLGQVPPEHYAPFDAALEKLFAARTNLEILREAVARKLLVAPTLTLAELDGLAALPRARELRRARARRAGALACATRVRSRASARRRCATRGRRRGSTSTAPSSAPNARSARPRAAAARRAGCRSPA